MLKNLANLIKVKTIVTLIVLAVWAYLAVTGTINADAVGKAVGYSLCIDFLGAKLGADGRTCFDRFCLE